MTPEDIVLASVDVLDSNTIYVLWFGWLFLVAELEYCNGQWDQPCWHSELISECLMGEARRREHWMACVSQHVVISGCEDK